ncbi:MAG: LytTR family DNA-binding domain-containing protein [Bacteroidota bacterium]
MSQLHLRCVIIDDEPLAREGLSHYIREIDFLDLEGSFENPLGITDLLEKKALDLIFLDIQMPKLNGIDFLKIAQNLPPVILTTAYPSYALEGFQLNVLDYLLKPITFDRFYQASVRAREYVALRHKVSETPDRGEEGYFFVKCEQTYEKIYFAEILFIEGLQNYVRIHTEKNQYITLMSMKAVEEKLNPTHFLRVHKSYIVSIGKIDSVERHEIRIGPQAIPVSRNMRETVMDQVVNRRLWRK